VPAIYKLLQSTFQMLQLLDKHEGTFGVCMEKTIAIKEGIKPATRTLLSGLCHYSSPNRFPSKS
jgi:hypothetical protein